MKWIFNHEIVEEDQLTIPVKDHGFLYGVGLFETFRVYDGLPFLFKEHIQRLQAGVELLGIDYSLDEKKLFQELKRLLRVNDLSNAYIRLTVSAGTAPFGMPTEKYRKPSILWQIKEMPPLSDSPIMDKKAVLLKTRRNSPETSYRLKTLNFLNSIVAKQEIMDKENTEGFFLTSEGYLAEGIVSNLFFVKSKKLYTPDLSTGILKGITRDKVIQIAGLLNYPVITGYFDPEELLDADEVFITNSIQEVVPIVQFEERYFNYNSESLVFQLIREYKRCIKIQLKQKM